MELPIKLNLQKGNLYLINSFDDVIDKEARDNLKDIDYVIQSVNLVKDLGNEFEVTTFALHKSKNINKIVTNIYNK